MPEIVKYKCQKCGKILGEALAGGQIYCHDCKRWVSDKD